MSSISNSGPASYTGDNRGAVLPADFLITTEDGVGRVGRLPGALPGAPYRRPAGVYVGSEGVESLGGFTGSGPVGGSVGTFLTRLESPVLRLYGIRLVVFADSPLVILPTDTVTTYLFDCTLGAIAVTLPAVGAALDPLNNAFGKFLHFQKLDAAANSVTITCAGTDLINGVGATNAVLAAQDSKFIAQAVGAFGGFNRWIA